VAVVGKLEQKQERDRRLYTYGKTINQTIQKHRILTIENKHIQNTKTNIKRITCIKIITNTKIIIIINNKIPTLRKDLPPVLSGETVAAASYSEKLAPVYQSTRSHIPVDRNTEAYFHRTVQPILNNHLQYAAFPSVLDLKPTVVNRLRARRSGFRIPEGEKDFCLLLTEENDFGLTQPPI
jgi:hypothetical protein